jgi:hypothetical protein
MCNINHVRRREMKDRQLRERELPRRWYRSASSFHQLLNNSARRLKFLAFLGAMPAQARNSPRPREHTRISLPLFIV